MPRVTWHGHATCTLETDDGTRIVIDPYFADNPACDVTVDDVGDVDFILVSHGHFDHFGDCIPLAKRTGATVISTFEIVSHCQANGVEKGHGMNIGGGYDFPFGRVKLTPAIHTGSVGGADGVYAACCGFLVHLDGTRFYHSGDTALTRDLELLAPEEISVAMLPIGDNFTMGPKDAVRAVEMIRPKVVIPIHYNTWDLIAQDPEEFRKAVSNRARVEVLKPGGSYEF
jgi:L-ascorbate metabolism protein UlaG (beta-lactamase superfamily)